MQSNAKRIAQLLKALANENRLLVLCALLKGPQNVGSLARRVPDISQSALSQHLAMMKARGILEDSKEGQTVTYRIADHRVEEVMAVLGRHYCPGGAIDDEQAGQPAPADAKES